MHKSIGKNRNRKTVRDVEPPLYVCTVSPTNPRPLPPNPVRRAYTILNRARKQVGRVTPSPVKTQGAGNRDPTHETGYLNFPFNQRMRTENGRIRPPLLTSMHIQAQYTLLFFLAYLDYIHYGGRGNDPTADHLGNNSYASFFCRGNHPILRSTGAAASGGRSPQPCPRNSETSQTGNCRPQLK
ncbi:uncharacterized protein BO66DRAFT_91480 [Aspergillus aculeatinus CBS 121060]|uniref:Uncharacterized protein n=1 Tax=Aspergillus aculeatinus CBS 121060 TaxID=1448322 RepID=A0ACD1H9F4_9EURO|nr:hypothetical protein BO66DRAFT_91480 [Aspergillus aculeatinus CBS 121060]RAH70202.1 hypothetical protein BO66DRAFT_91480 [Aspergillus aculeatinus CBS 121060]